MVSKPSIPKGRPVKYVRDNKGIEIVGLSCHKSTGRYYATHSNPRVYFGRDYPVALIKFREWQAKQQGERVDFKIPRKPTQNEIDYWSQHGDAPEKIITHKSIPRDIYIAQLRSDLSDPATCKLLAEETGFPLNRLAKFADPPKGLPLSKVWDNYENKRRKRPLKKDGKRDTKKYWDEFCKMVGAKTTSAITEKAIHDYGNTILKRLSKWSVSYAEARFTAVCAVLNASATKDPECRRVHDLCNDPQNGLIAPQRKRKRNIIVTPKQFETLLNGAKNNPKLYAMLLISLNCYYYPIDLCDLLVEDIDFDKQIDPEVVSICNYRDKYGAGVPRAACLWDITVDAIKKYQEVDPHGLPFLFATKPNKKGIQKQYTPKKVSKLIIDHCKRMNMPKNITTKAIRKAAYTYATTLDGQSKDTFLLEAKVLAGHAVPGVTDDYLHRNPRHVYEACQRIYRHFFEALQLGFEDLD